MRIWTVHPRYLDAKGLVALWREALLAQKVLRGETRGYRNHPQLSRFKESDEPQATIAAYLVSVHTESLARGYKFDASKIGSHRYQGRLAETEGQLGYEWEHLKRKLRQRAPDMYQQMKDIVKPTPHPLFEIIPGEVRSWEKVY